MHEFCFSRSTADLGNICMKKKMHECFGIETMGTFQNICSTFNNMNIIFSSISKLKWFYFNCIFSDFVENKMNKC